MTNALQRRPKLSEIARLAHTTPSTVSKVINGRPGVSEQTRQNIERILQDLDYAKNPVNHSRSTTLALVFESMSNPWVVNIMEGATNAAITRGLTVMVCAKTATDGTPDDGYRKIIRRSKPQAIIFDHAYVSMTDRNLCKEMAIPFAVVDPSGKPAQGCPEARVDNWTAGFEVATHFLELGHTKFAVICGPLSTPCYQARLDGFKAGLAQEDISLSQDHLCIGDYWSESARKSALKILDVPRSQRPTAIFACSDNHAFGIYDAAHQLGIRIPEELSIIGFDDIDNACHLDPPLTTMQQPTALMTSELVGRLLSSASKRKTVAPHFAQAKLKSLLYPPTMAVRGSTGPMY
ncbi:LacI family DNA-binding transcriptional regulator [Alloscardovia criceti]|uniref:LacI family DNA-binding transcriptional regulator n=1 Tax=Alloscardovia criceti TaxID=356828 RepID=UPI0003A90176|nr:LacI family DNA-binding transcriptional regulator [Alloscardovia criceti]